MFRMLEIVLRKDPVAGRVGVAGELYVFLEDMGGVAANLYIRSVALERPIALLVRGLTPAAALTLHENGSRRRSYCGITGEMRPVGASRHAVCLLTAVRSPGNLDLR